MFEVHLGEIDARKVNLVEDRPGQISSLQHRAGKICTNEKSARQVGIREIGVRELCLGQVSSRKVHALEVGDSEVSVTEITP